jgi:predicted Ser/Thr protein kinase
VNYVEYNFSKIKVYPGKNGVDIKNPTPYTFIGRGYTGAVFKLSSERCVKIFLKTERVKTEAKALETGANSPIMPKLYEVGDNYIIMEYIEGPNLFEYLLRKQSLSDKIAKEILFCIKELKRLEFPRINVHLRHFIVTKDKKIKVIDHANAYKKIDQKLDNLVNDFKQLGLLEPFLKYVKTYDYESFVDFFKGGLHPPL